MLILTHILPSEMKRKVNAFQECLQREPTFPNGSPSRRTIMRTSQIATQARDLHPEGTDSHRSRRLSRALGHYRQQQRLNHLVSRALGLGTRIFTDLHQAYGKWGQQPQQADQPVNALQLPFFHATPTFDALMIVLHEPALSIPRDPLPGLFQRCGGPRGHQDPFQRLLASGSLFFPDANDPHRHGVLARSWLIAWGQERHLPTVKLQLGRTCLAPMSGWNLKWMTGLTRPRSCLRQRVRDLCFILLHPPILGRSHQKVRLGRLTGLKERKHISTSISYVHPHASRLRGSNGLHLAHPDIAFALFSFAPLIALFSLGSGNAHKGLLSYAPEDLARLGTHCQHCLHEKSPSAFVADLAHAADLVTMPQIDVGGILHQQHHGRGIRLLPGL